MDNREVAPIPGRGPNIEALRISTNFMIINNTWWVPVARRFQRTCRKLRSSFRHVSFAGSTGVADPAHCAKAGIPRFIIKKCKFFFYPTVEARVESNSHNHFFRTISNIVKLKIVLITIDYILNLSSTSRGTSTGSEPCVAGISTAPSRSPSVDKDSNTYDIA